MINITKLPMQVHAFRTALLVCLMMAISCQKDKEDTKPPVEPSVNLALDSITTTKKSIIVWEEIVIIAHARGENLKFKWETSNGSMIGRDSVSVRYWGCPSCIGVNIIQCTVTNEFGSISDTIMVKVDKYW